MNCESMTASIWCNDHCGILVFDRTVWAKDDELLEFSFMDSYIRTYQLDLEKKLQQDKDILTQLSNTYRKLSAAPELSELLKTMDEVVPGHTMSIEKKLDFILWAMGGLSK